MSVDTSYISDPYLSVNTSQCKSQGVFDVSIDADIAKSKTLHAWIEWEGGIAFQAIFWIIILLLCFAIVKAFRWKFRWHFLTERFVGCTDQIPEKKCPSWISIDEQLVGKDGATYLWFQVRQITVYSWIMVLSIFLIIIHLLGDKQGTDKHIASTSLVNIGVNGIHSVFCMAVLFILVWTMNTHGRKRQIRSLANPNVPHGVHNHRWLMISGLSLPITIDSLFDYLKDRFHLKGISRDGIKFQYDLNEVWPVSNELKFVRKVKRTLVTSGPEKIRKRPLDLFYAVITRKCDEVDALKFYTEKEATLLAQRDKILQNLKFTGRAFVRFDSPAEAKATRKALKRLELARRFRRHVVEDQTFRPSRWTVQYAPFSSKINWSQLKKTPPFWKKMAIWSGLAFVYFVYIVFMAAPIYILQFLHLVGEETAQDSPWNTVIWSTIFTFFNLKLTDWVTNVDQNRHHRSLSRIDLGRFQAICYLSAVLYLIRMMATKPLMSLITGGFTIGDVKLACLFFPEHGSFITCALIVNTASGIWMNHVRLPFLWTYIWKWPTFRSNAEQVTWRKNYRLEFDFPANYAELTSNFGLTMLIFIMFPVIGVVSWACSICRFFSDRAAMMEIYAVSHTSAELHREPVDKTICLSIFSPLAFLGYRIIQLGDSTVSHLFEAGILGPLCVTIFSALYLIYAHSRFHSPKINQLREWFGDLGNEVEEEEEEVKIDSQEYSQHEYDPVAEMTDDDVHETAV